MTNRRQGIFSRSVSLSVLSILAIFSQISVDAAQPTLYPGAEWSRTTPEAAGWDPQILTEAHDYSKQIGTTSFIAIQHGTIVASWGDIDHRFKIYSARKSLLSALTGIAVNAHQLDLDDTLGTLGIDDVSPALTDSEKRATVRDLLESKSGVYHVALYETDRERRVRPVRGSHAPGTFWYYNNWDFNALGSIYEKAVGKSIFESFESQIAGPLEMQDYRVSDGSYERGSDSLHAAYLFKMSARDLARFGLLYLNDGRWKDQQVVPASWVAESTTPHSDAIMHAGYGYLWWTSRNGQHLDTQDLPAGSFWADGSDGQFVIVDPVDDLVVVHQINTRTVFGLIGNGNRVTERQMGHLMWLILTAAHAKDPGRDPVLSGS